MDTTGIIEFLYALKSLIRNTSSVCVFTISKSFISEDTLKNIENICDIVINMDSFTGNDMNIIEFQDFTGILSLEKLSKLNSLNYNYSPDTLNYVFTRKKRKLYIERMYLPPETTRSTNQPDREKFSSEKQKTSVKSISKKDLEF